MSVGGEVGQAAIPPLISIVIPVFNTENYLDACLDSILRQDFQHIEIVAVEGGFTDNSGDLLDRRAIEDSRLTVRHTGRIGPGQARNMGAAAAKGDYIWFVDGDDAISDGCLQAIADRLAAIQPDILFVNHEFCYQDGTSAPGYDHDLIASATALAFTLAEQRWAISLSLASWNKIYSRGFFLLADQPFSSDWPHEDVPVSCLLPLTARRLCVLNQVCYRYRKNRPGSAMLSGDARRHFRIFTAYETILEQVPKMLAEYDQALAEQIYAAYFERAIWHYTNIFDTDGLVAMPERRSYFATMHKDYRRYMPPGYLPPPGPRGVKFRLIERDAYRWYVVLARLNSVRVAR